MNSKKVLCVQCTNYAACSFSTKFFVNFCGAHDSAIAHLRERAVAECRTHRGYFFSSFNIPQKNVVTGTALNAALVR
ncbi:MAG TPA: hypothetical protein VF335_07170 [Chitinivibrionales bacterium]